MFNMLKELTAAKVGDKFKTNDRVPASGIYKVIHDKVNPQYHEVTCIEGRKFPPCRDQPSEAEFELVRIAIHIEKHPQFSEAK